MRALPVYNDFDASMTLVMVASNWEGGGLFRLTPGCTGRWDSVQFVEESVPECDYLLVINHPLNDVTVTCPPDRVWALMMEPPNEYYRSWHWGDRSYSRIYTSDTSLKGSRYVHSHPCLPWQIEKDYDFLRQCLPPLKERSLSWVTSNKRTFKGHKRRLKFLKRVDRTIEFDLYGYGFSPILDKWDGLAPYRYSIAVENFVNPYYWTEKIADCFLAWTMPIYYGCPRISDFFPAEAVIQIDIDDPSAIERIQETVKSDAWRKNVDAIAHARELVLEKYQIFPFMVGEMKAYEAETGRQTMPPQQVTVPRKPRLPMRGSAQLLARRVRSRITRRFSPL